MLAFEAKEEVESFPFITFFSSVFLLDFMAYFCLSYSSIVAGICYPLLIILVYKLYSRLYYSVHTFYNLHTYFIALFYMYFFGQGVGEGAPGVCAPQERGLQGRGRPCVHHLIQVWSGEYA